VDRAGRAPGRGAYLHATAECIELARKRRSVDRALKTPVQPELWLEIQYIRSPSPPCGEVARTAGGETQGPPRAEAPPGFGLGPGGIISSSGMKAHELARELGISQKELVNFLQQRRLTRNAAAPLAPGAIEAARTAFKPAVAT